MSSRFALFYGPFYYPEGGMWDFKGMFSSVEVALNSLPYQEDYPEDGQRSPKFDWFHVVDLETVKVVKHGFVRSQGNLEIFEEHTLSFP